MAHGFWMLLVGQLVLVISRACFWPATWAMASELPGARGVQLGRLNAVTNFGQIVGTTLCGFLLAAVGFQLTFAAMARPGRSRLPPGSAPGAAAQAPPRAPCARRLSAAAARAHHRLHGDVRLLSALPFSLTMSFYPVLLAHYGYGEEASGILLAPARWA